MTTATEYRIAPAPKHSALIEWDCAICHHESLAKPVFIDNGSGVIAAGTGCAARALGFVPANHVGRLPAKVVNEMASQAIKLAQAAELNEERMASAGRALADFDARPFGDDETPDLARWRSNFASAKRFGKVAANGLFRPYLVAASETGEV